MLSGTKISPSPSPWMMPLTMIGCWSISSEKPDICQSEKAISPTPAAISRRESTLPTSCPAISIETRVPTPRGAVSTPDSNTE